MEKLKLTVDDKGKVVVHMDGHLLHGVTEVELYWESGEIPHHKIGFATQVAKFERKYSGEE